LSDPHPEVISFLLSAMEAEHENRTMKDNIPKDIKVRWKDGNSSGDMAVNSVTTSNSVTTKSGASARNLV
jgi:hypothetical protein